MRRAVIIAAVTVLPLAGLVPSQAAEIRLQLSNFRFCDASLPMCGLQDQGYVAQIDGDGEALVPLYNTLAAVQVRPGDTVVWVYTDAMCDAIEGCPGHQVAFHDGTETEFAEARDGEIEISWTVPMSATPGLLPYFCPVNNHYNFGMTGLFEVLGPDPYEPPY